MPTYKVIEYANAIFTHMVDAKSEEEATKLVEMGLVEPKYTDYIEYEVMEVVELKDAK